MTHGGLDDSISKQNALRKTAAPHAWIRVVAIDAAGRRAWTNPIWLDALG
jgi:hypothetical protein